MVHNGNWYQATGTNEAKPTPIFYAYEHRALDGRGRVSVLAEIPMAIACGYRRLKFTVFSFSFFLFLSFLKSNVLTYCFPLILVLLPLAIPHYFRDLQAPQDSMPDPPPRRGAVFHLSSI